MDGEPQLEQKDNVERIREIHEQIRAKQSIIDLNQNYISECRMLGAGAFQKIINHAQDGIADLQKEIKELEKELKKLQS